jgi:hypothetical protein
MQVEKNRTGSARPRLGMRFRQHGCRTVIADDIEVEQVKYLTGLV